MCEQYNSLIEPLVEFNNASDAIICPFIADGGAGLGIALFGMLVFGFVGMGLTIRVQHPGPILVTGILTAGLVASTLPGVGAQILALILFFGISVMGLYVYRRAQTSL